MDWCSDWWSASSLDDEGDADSATPQPLEFAVGDEEDEEEVDYGTATVAEVVADVNKAKSDDGSSVNGRRTEDNSGTL